MIVAVTFDTPESCERAFYAAFENGDPEAMMAVWAEHAPLLCIHPGGPPLTTRDGVAQSWQQIFDGDPGMRFTLSDLRVVEDGDVSVRHVRENIHHGPDLRDTAVVLATNVFVREGGSWRMCVHHASVGTASVSAAGAVH